MYVRFVIDAIDGKSGVQLGIFQAMFKLWRSGKLSAQEESEWARLRGWLRIELEEPSRLTRSSRPNAPGKAVSWYKAGAKEHIAHARAVAQLLSQHDMQSHMVQTDRPGYVVYEDAYQIVAEPFRSELR